MVVSEPVRYSNNLDLFVNRDSEFSNWAERLYTELEIESRRCGTSKNNHPLWGSQALKKGFANPYSFSLSKRMLSLISRVIALFTVDGLLKPADFMNETEKTFFPPSIAMAMRHLS